jgi:mono/diheme cytochrome c family protein
MKCHEPAISNWTLITSIIAIWSTATIAFGQVPPPSDLTKVDAPATSFLSQPIADSVPNAAQLRRGQYLVAVGDCMSCHLRERGKPLAGGLGLKTPFGVIYSSNITSDRETGIGGWTSEQFYRAMHDGTGAHGENLYPAFPYPWFRLVSRMDDDAIFAYLQTMPAVKDTPPKNRLIFPLGIRSTVKGWNLFFQKTGDFVADPNETAEWNRGAYIVNGLGHCGACHTPKNFLGADKTGYAFRGSEIDNWVAPDLTDNHRTGLGGWTTEDIVEYLATGRNVRAAAGGGMADVITYSTSLMTDEDRKSISTYLKSQQASPDAARRQPDEAAMRRGAAIYSDACTACHLENGVGQARLFPPLPGNAMLQQTDAAGLMHLLLAGSRVGTSPSRPTPVTMPSFAWKLTDPEIADVSTFIRNSWGNHATPVVPEKVSEMRKILDLESEHLTVNSGDWVMKQ